MIYVTGDIHGEIERFKQLKDMGIYPHTEDIFIICGDFGLVWCSTESQHEADSLDWMANQAYTILFVDGNHENFDRLRQYPMDQRYGGKVQIIRPNVLHLLRGEVYDIAGKTFFAFGGATSTDKDRRIQGISWWPEEIPSLDEFAYAKDNLARVQRHIDYVVTHTAPQRWKMRELGYHDWDRCLVSAMLDDIEMSLTYDKWFFGHMHIDIHGQDRKDQWLYEDIIHLDGTIAGRLPLKAVEARLPEPLQEILHHYKKECSEAQGQETRRNVLRRVISEYRQRGQISDETAGRLVEEYCY